MLNGSINDRDKCRELELKLLNYDQQLKQKQFDISKFKSELQEKE